MFDVYLSNAWFITPSTAPPIGMVCIAFCWAARCVCVRLCDETNQQFEQTIIYYGCNLVNEASNIDISISYGNHLSILDGNEIGFQPTLTHTHTHTPI